ncbi:MAG: DNA mismatch repair endonuclease MutL [Spirochaetaceae bacterium]|nr:MAG: DNA mismatch repair endonuclease MutL [Spirochaetaceae bacterium]
MESSAAQHTQPPVRVLSEQVARKIAAGEVIDRPYSVVRELIDNALDAQADSVDIWLEDGGRSRLQVVDNGVGMDAADVELCCRPHATSKIENETDLENVSSLGFRGEALSSIATVARLEIRSSRSAAELGRQLVVHSGEVISLEPCQPVRGTSVTVEDLFYSLPARRKFLKRASAETIMCRNVLIDKAVAFPEVAFRLFVDGELKLFLPPQESEQRVLSCYPEIGDRKLLSTVKGSGDGFSIEAVTTGSSMLRRDRKLMQVFVNRRRVWEYALVQAMQYAFEAVAPGGSYPICFLFVRCEPRLVDFNIHPAKREVRFRNLAQIHRRSVETLSGFLRAAIIQQSGPAQRSQEVPPQTPYLAEHLFGGNRVAESAPLFNDTAAHQSSFSAAGAADQFHYVGQLFDLFLLASRKDRLYIVDQHAGHERILYDRFRSDRSRQELLVPLVMEVSDEEEQVLLARLEQIADLGVRLERAGPGQWSVTAAATAFLEHQEEVVETIREIARHPQEISHRFYAQMACKAAVKQGNALDPQAATDLLQQIFALPEPRCPHGRPLWAELSREQLYSLVGRT